MPLPQLERVEENLRNLARRAPQLPETETLILRCVVILGRDISAMLEHALKPAGLTETEFKLLMALYSHGGSAYAGDVCGALAQSPANLTRVSDALVAQGYITRTPDLEDRRRMLLTLQATGEQRVHELLPLICPTVAEAFAGFTATELQQLFGGLKRLMAGIDMVNARAAAAPGTEEQA